MFWKIITIVQSVSIYNNQVILDDQTLGNIIIIRPFLVVKLAQIDQVSEKLIVSNEFCPKTSGFMWILLI